MQLNMPEPHFFRAYPSFLVKHYTYKSAFEKSQLYHPAIERALTGFLSTSQRPFLLLDGILPHYLFG